MASRGISNQVILIAAIAVAGQAVAYGLAITVARLVGVDGFEAYAVAAAAFLLMVAIATFGLDRFAVRLMPALIDRQDWAQARGFLGFGLRWILSAALSLAVLVGLLAWQAGGMAAEVRTALIVSCIAVPPGALAHFGVEVVSAAGRESFATMVVRVAVPAMALVVIGIVWATDTELTGPLAIGAWLAAWIASLPVLAVAVWQTLPRPIFAARPATDGRAWVSDAAPFWLHRGAMAVMGQASVLLLEVLQPSGVAVAVFAAVTATTTPPVIAVVATNRAYARRLSIMLARCDVASIDRLQSERLGWALPVSGLYLVGMIIFAPQLLGLFGPAFTEAGVTALRLSATASAFTMVFALAPTFLKFTRKGKAPVFTVAVAAFAQIVLLWLLVPALGVTGAALANGVAVVGMYSAFALLARRDLATLRMMRGSSAALL